MVKKRLTGCRYCKIALCLRLDYVRIYYMKEGFWIHTLTGIIVSFLVMVPAVDSLASETDILRKVKSEGTCDEGFFNVWNYQDRYWFEIPDSLFSREMLLVTCRARTSMDMGFRSESIDERIFVWEKRGADKIELRAKSFRKVAADGSELAEAVKDCMLPTIISTFDVTGKSAEGNAMIEVTDLFRKDILAFGLDYNLKKRYSIGSLEDKSSYINYIKSFPSNIDVLSTKTYSLSGNSSVIEDEGLRVATIQIHNSLLLLPQTPMMPRYSDSRVGYFSRRQYDYGFDGAQRAIKTSYINRWKLEPSDPEAYFAGKTVDPVKPIVFYLSPAIPKKWVKYFKEGVEDWQEAFEAAGFSNAILAKTAPTEEEDPDFDPLDARYSMIEYFPSYVENSYGPAVVDPRSGEIINSHVCIYHNAMKLLHDWYMIQCGQVDPQARKMVYDDALMGRLVRYLVCHEVGHTLGLMHNFGASNAFPTDSLRSATFTAEYGTTPSIMDYARFNYVAQPEDKGLYLFPKIGEYDRFAIEWGYRLLPGVKSPEDERLALNNFVKAHSDDPKCKYIKQFLLQSDPRGQTEDLGDDPIKSAAYGLSNLRIVADSLEKWTYQEAHDYADLEDLYRKVQKQWSRYMGHITVLVTGVYEDYKTADQPGPVFYLPETGKQKEALDFLSKYAFNMPEWLIGQSYIPKFDMALTNTRRVQEMQATILYRLLNVGVLMRMDDGFAANPERVYDPSQYLEDVRKAVWKDIYGKNKSDIHLRVLERAYLTDCKRLLEWRTRGDSNPMLDMADYGYKTIIRTDLVKLRYDINFQKTKDPLLRQHYAECLMKIDNMLKIRNIKEEESR